MGKIGGNESYVDRQQHLPTPSTKSHAAFFCFRKAWRINPIIDFFGWIYDPRLDFRQTADNLFNMAKDMKHVFYLCHHKTHNKGTGR